MGLLRSAVRRDIVDTLANLPRDQRDEGLSARELGDRVGLHLTTVRFHVRQLIEAGVLTSHSVRTSGVGRPTKRYRIAAGSLEHLPDVESHRLLAGLLAETFDARHEDGRAFTPEEVGMAWVARNVDAVPNDTPASTPGEWFAVIGSLIDVLQEWGYSPVVGTENAGRTARIDIVGCPLLSLAQARPEIVCGIHRGLIRGTLEALGEHDAEFSLEPFVTPTQCLAHVTTRADLAPRGGNS